MNFTLLLVILAIISAGLTYVTAKIWDKSKSWIMSFLQYFTGLLFVVSGFVKAVDPLGTSYKMEEYFQEFQSLFEPTWFSFLVPVFHYFEQYSLGFGIFMIIFETVLGIMLIVGFRPKLTAWLYLALVLFFTVLTGYTYLTGYVPQGVNFFDFSHWGEFKDTNMKVTDCGCFGDFIKFSAWHTFLKDVFLLIPGIYFVIRYKDMHNLFNRYLRAAVVFASIFLLWIFNLSNYSWGLPVIDFRPFKEGVNIRERMQAESEAQSNTVEKTVVLKNKNTGKIKKVEAPLYYKSLKDYPDSIWIIKDRIFTEPAIPITEISDFTIEDFEGNDHTQQLLGDKNYSFMIVSWNMKGEGEPYTYTVHDTVYQIDTVHIADTIFLNGNKPYVNTDSFKLVKRIKEVRDIERQGYNYIWDEDYLKAFVKYINPLVTAARKDGYNAFVVTAATEEMVKDFVKDGGPDIPYYNSDDITLKAIIRSNPGVVLLKDGKIIKKWHYKNLPSYEEIKRKYLK